MLLQALPVELLTAIARYLIPDDGINELAYTCRTIYDAIQPLLGPHNERVRKYCHPDPETSVLQLLLAIADDPEAADYIQSLEVDYHPNSTAFPVDPISQKNLATLVHGSSHLKHLRLDPAEWLQHIIDNAPHDEGVHFAFVFLLPLLPNLATLRSPNSWNALNVDPDHPLTQEDVNHEATVTASKRSVSQLLRFLVSNANSDETHQAPLGKLRILLDNRVHNGQFGESIMKILPFLALDSLRELEHSGGAYDEELGNDDADALERKLPAWFRTGKNIQRLTLKDYVLGGGIPAQRLLSPLLNLQHLTLEYSAKDNFIGEDWDAGSFLSIVECHCCTTLETLSLTMGSFTHVSYGLESFNSFEALRELKVSLKLFYLGAYQQTLDDSMCGFELEHCSLQALEEARDQFPLPSRDADSYMIGHIQKPNTRDQREGRDGSQQPAEKPEWFRESSLQR